jgi:hypothetical protein
LGDMDIFERLTIATIRTPNTDSKGSVTCRRRHPVCVRGGLVREMHLGQGEEDLPQLLLGLWWTIFTAQQSAGLLDVHHTHLLLSFSWEEGDWQSIDCDQL